MTRIISTVLAGAMLAVSATAGAECAGVTTTSIVTTAYDPFAAANEIADFSVGIDNSGQSSCSVRLYAQPSTGGNLLQSNADKLLYRIDSVASTSSGNAGEIGPFQVIVGPGQHGNVGFRLVIPAQQIVPRGIYQTQFALRIVDEANTDLALRGRSANFTANVPARVEMNISGGASTGSRGPMQMAPASINFGNAHSGQSEHVFVNIWSNGSVNVALSSENRGLLKHVLDSSLPPIMYRTRFDGETIDLGSVTNLSRTPPASLSGASYELDVTLGDVSQNFAGQYKDVVTVSVTEN